MSRFSIKSVKAREIIDCRGYPTLQVSVQVESGALEIPGDTIPISSLASSLGLVPLTDAR